MVRDAAEAARRDPWHLVPEKGLPGIIVKRMEELPLKMDGGRHFPLYRGFGLSSVLLSRGCPAVTGSADGIVHLMPSAFAKSVKLSFIYYSDSGGGVS